MPKLDFPAIKASVTIQQVMDLLGIKVTRWANSEQARCKCPCGAGDNEALSVNVAKNKFQCFGSKPHASGDIITFLAHARGMGLYDAGKLLKETFMARTAKPASEPTAPTTVANDNTSPEPQYDDALEAFIAQLE